MPALQTRLVHVGEPRIDGAVAMPIFQTAMYVDTPQTDGDYHSIRYIRLNNVPNHVSLCAKLASAEGAEAALVTGSGMAAISTALLALLRGGDHLLVQDCLYGGTHTLVTEDLARLGIDATPIGDDPAGWASALRPSTRVVLTEAITNPLLQVPDHGALTAFARANGLTTVIDATMASPVNFRPLEWGYDVVVHSATKYLNGHSDIVAGAVCGSSALMERIKATLDHLGGSLDPHAAGLFYRGLKTLTLRVRQQNAGALAVARFLERHPAVERVNYPLLDSHPHRERAARYLEGGGGVLSFELAGGEAAATRFIERVTLPVRAPSFGGVESLVTRPSQTSHAGVPPDERLRIGISDALVRMSVGIEDPADLLADLGRALG